MNAASYRSYSSFLRLTYHTILIRPDFFLFLMFHSAVIGVWELHSQKGKCRGCDSCRVRGNGFPSMMASELWQHLFFPAWRILQSRVLISSHLRNEFTRLASWRSAPSSYLSWGRPRQISVPTSRCAGHQQILNRSEDPRGQPTQRLFEVSSSLQCLNVGGPGACQRPERIAPGAPYLIRNLGRLACAPSERAQSLKISAFCIFPGNCTRRTFLFRLGGDPWSQGIEMSTPDAMRVLGIAAHHVP